MKPARAAALLGAAVLLVHACSRTELPVGPARIGEATAAFCADARYDGGFEDLSIYLLLDRSSSMQDDGKWSAATAAVGSFVSDPEMAGLRVGLQYFPLGSSCDPERYATPAVPIAPLPDNAAAIHASLAGLSPEGQTPTRVVLRSALTHARGLLLGEPTQAVVLALVTDGAPNDCDSGDAKVAAVAADGATGSPQIRTFVIGLETGYLDPLVSIAEAGGTGEPIVLDETGAAQQLVDALRSLRATLQECRYAIPPVPGAVLSPADVTVEATLDEAPQALAHVRDASSCTGDGFHVDDPATPRHVQLCPATCTVVKARAGSTVTVTAGCGDGAEPGDSPPVDTGDCTGAIPFECVAACDAAPSFPLCVHGSWRCPIGTFPYDVCVECPAVPAGCCNGDGSLAEASCIDGAWTCPPGAALFGEPGCRPPDVCAPKMPCAASQVCTLEDFACGETDTAGRCEPRPASCDDGPAACGCDGQTYASACAAAAAGVDVSVTEICAEPPGDFVCGPLFCHVVGQICRRSVDLGGAPTAYACVDAPAGCATGCGCDLCDCAGPCTESCTLDDLGGRTVTCTGAIEG